MTGEHVGRRMIENIKLAKCTSCGIYDDVGPADVIHVEPVPIRRYIFQTDRAGLVEGTRELLKHPYIICLPSI
jgi:hypothetical protein